MNTRKLQLLLALCFGLLMVVGTLTAMKALAGEPRLVQAGTDGIITVCKAGPPTCDYAIIQDAVDAAGEGDVIKVATGVYTGVQGRPQVVYISKSIALRGGYTTTNWTTPDPEANRTVLDALGQGRVVLITGTIRATVEGLHITGGDASEWGGRGWEEMAESLAFLHAPARIGPGRASTMSNGAGILVEAATAIIIGNWVYSNTATFGGGLYLYESEASLIGNSITANTADLWGGGLLMDGCHYLTLTGNLIVTNTAYQGGGLLMGATNATLSGNLIAGNSADCCEGGLLIGGGDVTLDGNTIVANTANGQTGGLGVYEGSITLSNNLIADNEARIAGAGLVVYASSFITSSVRLVHNTIARNTGGDGSGVLLVDWGDDYSTVILTNTILVSHTVGISVAAGNTAKLEGTLWGSGVWGNEVDWGGEGTIVTGTVNVWGPPEFVDPEGEDYHISSNSAAVDAGVETGITVDIDGEPRPLGIGYDIGADELPQGILVTKQTSPDPVLAGEQLTYTIRAVNASEGDLHATVTDTLPAQVTPTGVLTWTPAISGLGGAWTQEVVVMVEAGYSGPLVNLVQVTSSEGISGAYTSTVMAYIPPTADLTAAPTYGPAPLTVVFTNTSTGDFTDSLWAFGDGMTGTLQHPTHIFEVAGVYTVALLVSGPGGADTFTRTNYITAYEQVSADFVADPTEGVAPLTVTFNNTSTGEYGNSLWDFGDGLTSTLPSPTHTYSLPGAYTVSLTISGLGGADTITRSNYITAYEQVQAGFAATPTSGLAPLMVTFATTSTGDYAATLWDFGDGVTSTLESPAHIYTTGGVYTVALTVTGPGGSDVETKVGYIEVWHGVYLPLWLRND